MTKPSDFTMNSDYVSLAQTASTELTAYFPAEHFNAGQQITRTRDFTVSPSQGSVDMFLISLNGDDYTLGAKLVSSVMNPLLQFRVYRVNQNTIRVNLHEYNNTSGGFDMPMQTVKIKVSSFKPPNIF